ncbi:MAG: type II secretion system protein [Clostridiaceae bacterium]|nr:type II secretion system protein [Clostridiaceae bacterium]
MLKQRKKIHNGGFSLVELLVSAALLFILAAGFIPLLTNSYSGIFLAGEKNKSANLAQGEIEKLFSTGTTDDADILAISFVDGMNITTIEVPGRKISVEKGSGDNKVTYSVFIPKR